MGQEARQRRAKAWDRSEEVDCDPSALNSRIDADSQTSDVGEFHHHSPEGRHLAEYSTSAFAVEASLGEIEIVEVWKGKRWG